MARQGTSGALVNESVMVGNNMFAIPEVLCVQYLKDGSTRDMSVDGSSTPVQFFKAPASGNILDIYTIRVVIYDTDMEPALFGSISALTNGVQFHITETDGSTELVDFTDGFDIKVNADINSIISGDSIVQDKGAGGGMDMWSWLWESPDGTPIRLTDERRIQMIVNDDLTAIDFFGAMIQGIEVPE